jgi:hypothetical protein
MGSDLGSIRRLVVGGIFLSTVVFTRIVDGDLDRDGTTTDVLALEGVNGLLLFSLVTNVDETVTLAFSGLPPPSDDASRVDVEAGIGEESGEAGVVDVEAEVGDEENGRGRFADGIFTDGTRRTSPRLALPGFGSVLCGRISCGSVGSRSGGLSVARLGLVAALNIGSG